MISLQSVIALSYGTIQLLYTDKPGALLHPTSLKPLTWRADDDGNRTGRAVTTTSQNSTGGTGKQFMLVLNEIAIKFLGVLKIPPNGSTAFYLFGDADSTTGGAAPKTGLAWYAVYNNEPKTKGDDSARLASLTKGSAGNE
ncbi:hypothetical protein [Pectobacterium brasiliense]|uniref:hypothetical protein n=1 Tax=Pectobacterium brasiliense TaxID=180957 RepID=UPI001969614A|nr:hypothetical protein [Pectobacterium brasiliense]MBN3121888.1 hypothetical protein [Pectobacterium brasiliense]